MHHERLQTYLPVHIIMTTGRLTSIKNKQKFTVRTYILMTQARSYVLMGNESYARLQIQAKTLPCLAYCLHALLIYRHFVFMTEIINRFSSSSQLLYGIDVPHVSLYRIVLFK